MRRLVSPLAVLGLLAALLLAAPWAASAAPVRAAAGACDPAAAYPPAPDATVQVNTTSPFVGETIEVSGINYCPNEDVDITIDGVQVATGHTDARGDFDPSVKVGRPVGDQRVCGIGASGLPADRDCLTITVRAAGSANGTPGTDTGNPAMTGVEIALLGLLALVLVVAGVVLTTVGRHRKASARV